MTRWGGLALAALGALLLLRMWTLSPPSAAPAEAPDEVATLLDGLTAAGLATVGTDARLVLPEPDLALAAAWRGQPLDAKSAVLVRDLYSSAAGAALLRETAQWNRGRRLSAVRDDGAAAGAGTLDWRAYDCTDGRLLGADAPVSESFGYLHQGRLQLDLGAWTAVAAGDGDCVEWRAAAVADRPVPLRVQLLGRPLEDLGRSATRALPPRQPDASACLGPVPDAAAGEWHIARERWQQRADGRYALALRLRLAPARTPGLDSGGLRIGVAETPPVDSGSGSGSGSDIGPGADIDPGTAAGGCRALWQPLPATGGGALSAPWQILAADGPLLLTDAGRPTAAAESLGLVPVVGFGPGDYHGLGSRLSGLAPGGRLALTIDTRLQTAAREALAAGLARFAQDDPYRNERRAALVLLDTDGAILAAAGVPEPPPLARVHPWDLAAFARVYPLENPLLVRAWEGLDRHLAPGSTLKPVAALAGLAAAGEDPQLARMIAGLPPADFERLTGLGLDATEIDPYAGVPGGNPGGETRTLKNFMTAGGQRERVRDLLGKPLSAGCPGQSAGRGDLGLASAVRDSLNVWFASLALQLDGAAADRFQNDPRPLAERARPALRLAGMLDRLGFGQTEALLVAAPGDLGRRMPRSEADGLDLAGLGRRPLPLRWVLAQTAIGQGAQVAPLRMAALAATLAHGERVRPRLDGDWNGRAVAPRVGPALGLDLAELRRGMAAVVQVGTAARAFRDAPAEVRCRTYAKTGTAQIARRDGGEGLEPYVSAWTIGWYALALPGRKLAFACVVTHAQGDGLDSGGAVCGPIVARLLTRIAADRGL